MMDSIRPARPADAPAIRELQSFLAEPAPTLLSAALAGLAADEDGVSDTDGASAADGAIPAGSRHSTTTRSTRRAPRVDDGFRLLVSVADAVDPSASSRPVGYLLALVGEGTHLAELAVAPDFRRAGRGRALCRRLVATAPSPVTVHVAADNTAARRCYESVGFHTVERVEDRFETASGLTLRHDGSGENSS